MKYIPFPGTQISNDKWLGWTNTIPRKTLEDFEWNELSQEQKLEIINMFPNIPHEKLLWRELRSLSTA